MRRRNDSPCAMSTHAPARRPATRSRRTVPILLLAALAITATAIVYQRIDAAGGNAIDFGAGGAGAGNNTNAYVKLGPTGDPTALHLTSFTLEAWVRREGTSLATSTGSGGVTGVPIITKGRAENDGSNVDMNFFMGMTTGGVLLADFEDTATGGNHPVTDTAPTTAIPVNTWTHVAVTFGSNTWNLYVNGALVETLSLGATTFTPRFDSIQQAAIGSALTSTGVALGFFSGAIDEARIWNVVRTQAQIQGAMNSEILSAPNLVARYDMNEGTGTTVADSSGSANTTGTIIGTTYAWTAGAPSLAANVAPNPPVNITPAPGATNVGIPTTLAVQVSDPDSSTLSVSFYGRPLSTNPPDFTIIALPDTQYYAKTYPATFSAQGQWIVNNLASLNTVFVTGLGDCTDDGDSQQYEWDTATAAYGLLEDSFTTGLPFGLPFSVSVGNHDQTPNGDPGTVASEGATTNRYNATFGVSRFTSRPYYGGHYGANNDNHYELFSASGMDFINISFEFDNAATSTLRDNVLVWANNLLAANPGRRAIVTSHYILNPAGTFGTQGQKIYDALKGNPNLFLMLSGHLDQANRRTDTFGSGTVHSLLSDYQTQPNGGNGWLRIMNFKPNQNKIYVYTYSPTLNQYKTDAINEFILDYNMTAPFALIATNSGVPSGGITSTPWNGLQNGTPYEWYATVSDGASTTTGPTWMFTTAPNCFNPAPDDATCNGIDDDCDGQVDEDFVSTTVTCGLGVCASTGTTTCVGGVVTNNCVATTPPPGNDVSFNGIDAYVDLGNAAAITNFGTSSFTVEGWFKTRSIPAADLTGIFRHGRQGAASQVVMQFGGAGAHDKVTASVEDTAGHQVDITPPVALDLINVWNHFAVVVDRSANQLRLYLNGNLAGSADASAWGTNPISSADNVVLGAARVSGGTLANFFDGEIDEVRIWNSARSVTDILQNYRKEIASAPGLLARWGLNEGVGTTTANSVGGALGTLVNATWIAGSPIGVDATCNGLDDDCDGVTDEDYAPDASCGIGPCRASNTPSSCVNGVETPCQPGPGAANDSVCNGIDDDCNGAVDEDFTPSATSCGAGVCTAAGMSTCVAGVPGDTCLPGSPAGNYGMDFDGANEYVTFGAAPGLGASTFTIETWFNRQGPGVATSTGSGGITDAIPLVTKGRAEAEGSNVDMNYFLGIRASDGVLVADFEDTAGGANHPVAGTTAVASNYWNHAAATYDGTTWRLYLNGNLEATLAANRTPRSDSIQHAAIATAMNSTGVAAGSFDGVIDEARIWNVARSQAAIQAGMSLEIASATGLIGRFGFNEGSGAVLHDTGSSGTSGVIAGGTWVAGSPRISGPVSLTDGAVSFNGTSDYVTFGAAPALGSTVFTIETWFNRNAGGATSDTGTNGVIAYPLLTKGRGEAEGSNVDMNYFLGIRATDGVLVADFEDNPAGNNHPVIGVTPVTTGTWHHAAAVYDGSAWRLYLDGELETTQAVGATPRANSIQHAALGSALNSTGVAQGFFAGSIDEARVWHVSRTQSQILAGMMTDSPAGAGLVARWALDEAGGTAIIDAAGSIGGTLNGGTRVDGYPFNNFIVATDATCDGNDDDCDGTADEEYIPTPTSCSTGSCSASGQLVCSGGQTVDTCQPPVPTAETCNGLDDDCDGTPDDGNPGGGAACSTGLPGACSAGVTACNGGTLACQQTTQPASEICDGIDNDCDGSTDEGLGQSTCGTGACQRTVDNCFAGQTQTCSPGAPANETCNNLDDDCDGSTDEELGQSTCGTGACQRTVDNCVAGQPQTCSPGTGSAETCNGLDDDCDGAVDNGNPGGAQSCNTGLSGVCSAGLTACSGGSIVCNQTVQPSPETCDGLDNDCNGLPDDGGPGGGQTCNTGVPGVCAQGVTICTPGGLECSQTVQPSSEVCDGLDNDCDGSVDEGNPGGGMSCNTGLNGACAAGLTACTGGSIVCSQTTQPSPETCDGTDEDCDGAVDNGNPGGDLACNTGLPGACSAGATACASGAIACQQTTQPSAEVCDGIDNDCDASTDEALGQSTCGTGTCQRTVDNCVAGQTQTCSPGTGSSETCNGLDDDCDGSTDEGLGQSTCGTGACQRTVDNCVAGQTQTCSPGTGSPETCNGLDDDCDGQTDEDLGVLTCGVGTCARTAPACLAGVPGTCSPGLPTAEVCDGLDNDCDGLTDEQLGQTTCGTGACQRTVDNCAGGHAQTCSPGVGSSETCNGLDDDCDGLTDEGLGQTTCGLGGCQRTVDNCVAGQVQTCSPGAGSPETCNNVDDDCNGLVDDGLGLITCGTGACGNVAPVCVNGQPGVCVPLPPNQPAITAQSGSAMKYLANGASAAQEDTVLVQIDTPMRYLANASDPGLGLSWTGEAFNDGGWSNGTYGVGYETTPPGAVNLIRTSVPAGTLSVFTRTTLNIADTGLLRGLYLRADYDDGFVAYVNGVEVARSSTMPAGDPAWNAAPTSHESSNGTVPDYGSLRDISAALPLLHNGANVLSIGVWNINATSTDLVLVPKLTVGLDWTTFGYDDSGWSSGQYGVGYETGTTAPVATALLTTTVPSGSLSVFTRRHFNVADPMTVGGVYLGADYDDGIVAWVNGVEVYRSPEMPLGPITGSTDAALHESSNGAAPNYGSLIDISTRARPALRAGDNVLAIGVWNSGGTASTDLVLVPYLSLGESELCNGIDDDCDGLVDEGFPNHDQDGLADCVDPDDDNDASADGQDCQPYDPLGSAAPPAEVAGVRWIRSYYGHVVMVWTDQGPGLRYDVAGGLISQLRPDGGAGGAACVTGGDDLSLPEFEDPRFDPAPGAGYYYIIRSESNACGAGTYGHASSGAEILPASACP